MIADDLKLSFYKGPRGGVGTRPKLISEQGMRGLSPPPPVSGTSKCSPASKRPEPLPQALGQHLSKVNEQEEQSGIKNADFRPNLLTTPTTSDPGTVVQGSLQATVGQEFLSHPENLSPGDTPTGSSGSSSSRHTSRQGDTWLN